MMAFRCFMETIGSGRIRLPDAEARHAGRSRRLSIGDELVVFDGCGHEASGSIVEISRSALHIDIGPIRSRPRPRPALTLAAALPKGPRQDMLVEKCTELGVAVIQPLLTERSVSEASDHKLEKWKRKAIEAAKQSQQSWLPHLSVPRCLDEVIAGLQSFDTILLAEPPRPGDEAGEDASHSMARFLSRLVPQEQVVALVGPEGGWSETELEKLESAGAERVCLGPSVLRVETAAIVIASLIHMISQ